MTMQHNDLLETMRQACAPVGLVTVPERRGAYRNCFKRIFDMLAVVLTSVVVVPLVAILAVVLAMEGHKPFYVSERVGRGGRPFRMLKLRTMVDDADDQLADYLERNAHARSEWEKTQKLKSDPRITAVGHFLRKSSLDELPQLWNIFVGDMSLVGPRPMMPCQRAMYPGLSYYGLRPGLTGPWQISSRNDVGFSQRSEFDGQYDDQLSLGTDVRILLKTVGAVLRGTGY